MALKSNAALLGDNEKPRLSAGFDKGLCSPDLVRSGLSHPQFIIDDAAVNNIHFGREQMSAEIYYRSIHSV
jgi:hypothetical protein